MWFEYKKQWYILNNVFWLKIAVQLWITSNNLLVENLHVWQTVKLDSCSNSDRLYVIFEHLVQNKVSIYIQSWHAEKLSCFLLSDIVN